MMMRLWPSVFVAGAVSGVVLLTSCAKSSDAANATATTAAAAIAVAPDPAKGAVVFATNCAVCHGAKGVGGGVGPALVGEKQRKNVNAAIAWIADPQPPMPKLYPSPLSQRDVANVAAYVETL
jgi:mono/diheme cytochrome c family protein